MRLTNEKATMQPQLSDLALVLGLLICCLPTLTWAATLSDKRLCADPKCEQIISMGIAKITYAIGGEGLISFKINSPIRVLSKSAGSNMQLWGVDINGRRGYANKDFIMEKKILVRDKDLLYEVPVVGPGSPVQSVETPVQSVETTVQPVLNASESTDDLATTTTSPLEIAVDSIVVEHDKLQDQQVPDPTAASKAQVQVIEGTELPLEAIAATTEGSIVPETAADPQEATNLDSTVVDTKEPQALNSEAIKLQEEPKAQQPATEAEKPPPLPQAINAELEDADDFDYGDDETDDDSQQGSQDNESIVEIANDNKSINESIELKPLSVAQLKKTDKVEDSKDETKEKHAEMEVSKQEDSSLPTETLNVTALEEQIDQKEFPKQVLDAAVELKSSDPLPVEEVTETVAEPPRTIVEDKINEEIVPVSAKIQAKPATVNPTEPIVAQSDAEIKAPSESVISSTTPAPVVEEAPQKADPVGLPPLFEKKNFENPNNYYKQLQEEQEKQRLVAEAEEQKRLQEEADQQKRLQEEAALNKRLLEEAEQQKRLQEEAEQQKRLQEEAELNKRLLEEAEKQKRLHEESEQLQRSSEEAEPQLSVQEANMQQLNDSVDSQSNEIVDNNNRQQPEQYQQHHHHTESAFNHPSTASHTTPTPDAESPYAAVQEETTEASQTDNHREGVGYVEPVALPATASPVSEVPIKEDAAGFGLFATIVDTVNNFIGKDPQSDPADSSDELHRILYPGRPEVPPSQRKAEDFAPADVDGYCARFQAKDEHCHRSISLDNFVEVMADKLVDHSQLLLCVVIAAISSLFFMFAYYCFCNSSQEGALLSKLNHLERSLLASHKENLIIKHDLMTTRTKLASIEDNSFGSNDMVADLKKQLESELYEKAKLQEQDLDNAAEAGLELNKMLSEVLNGQNGDEAFMSTVDELQRQLNDQEKIIIEINNSLAEKSRENSELQYTFTEATTRLNSELKTLQEDNYELEMEKSKLQTRLQEIQAETESELAKALEARNYEMQKLQNQIVELTVKWEREHGDLQTSLAKIEALEDCLKAVGKDAIHNVQELITSAKTRGELNAVHKKLVELQSKVEQEEAHKQRLESQLQQSSQDVEQLKQDFNQSERDKLEAQTRLEVLSGYFREKENDLKKELSLQETKWLQHQGENASTVETQTLMKNEIQTLKSQNDELRAEIEAQIASHKAQMGTLENRAHESWLAARQSERRCEEALAEAASLRRKLTTMASGGGGVGGDPGVMEAIAANGTSVLGAELKTAPSPLPLPGSPLLNMPNPLPFLAAPFSPFMGLPPPFLPPTGAGGARPPPLGRMRSPPPSSRGDRDRERYSDYSDYDDYDDDEEDDRGMDRRRRHSGSWGRRHRGSYSHSPRTYRSLSPSDSRYNYNDTETDFSPPPSPPPVPSGRSATSRPYSEV
uniref:Transport and golgi organization 1, isoform D n=1 Tax=Drosophila melanogaster TaxID=7227 RepID=X2J786_DROME|nr:transport and golgi organization 1, isoform D [Drosophila melanogaster]AHN54199.1 transport and golgi organization 1, isoform D [Drosophila melanogaster]|eukprot:NP_001285684.1 transport and golgi organization 1, isoform D [Drosophila melanogaster]